MAHDREWCDEVEEAANGGDDAELVAFVVHEETHDGDDCGQGEHNICDKPDAGWRVRDSEREPDGCQLDCEDYRGCSLFGDRDRDDVGHHHEHENYCVALSEVEGSATRPSFGASGALVGELRQLTSNPSTDLQPGE